MCETAADTAAKVVTLANFDALISGVQIAIKFTYTNTALNPTLNVNGTGAKNIYANGTNPPGTTVSASWAAGSLVTFTYDGTVWRMNDVGANAAIIGLVNTEASSRATADSTYQQRTVAAYSSSATYKKGDLRVYSEQIYEANQDIDTAEAWDSTHWNLVTLGGKVEDRELKSLKFTNVSVPTTTWADDSDHTDYPKKATIALTGVTADMIPFVAFNYAQADSGDYSTFAETYNGGVYIYAATTPSDAITIPTIICWRA